MATQGFLSCSYNVPLWLFEVQLIVFNNEAVSGIRLARWGILVDLTRISGYKHRS